MLFYGFEIMSNPLLGYHWNEWACPANLCPQLPELLHQGHAAVQNGHPQYVCWHPPRWVILHVTWPVKRSVWILDMFMEVVQALTLMSSTVVEYKIADMGHVKYYLAPKIDEEAS